MPGGRAGRAGGAGECWAKKQPSAATKLMDALGHLTWPVDKLDANSRDLLLAAAPFMYLHHNVYELLEELDRLASVSPVEVALTEDSAHFTVATGIVKN